MTNRGRVGARDLPNGVMPHLTFVSFRRGVRGRANTLVRGSLGVGFTFIGFDLEAVGEGSELRAQLLFDDGLAAFQLLQVSLTGGGHGMLEGFGIHGFEVVFIEGMAISNSLSLHSLVGIMVEVMAVAYKASLEIVHAFGHPGDDVTVFSLVEEDAASVFTKVVGLDEEPVYDVGVSAVNIQDTIVVRYEEVNEHFLHGLKLASDPAVRLFGEGDSGGSNGALGSADVLIT